MYIIFHYTLYIFNVKFIYFCTFENILFTNIKDKHDFYFVHSFYFKPNEDVLIGTTEYGFEFTSVVNKDNIFATQFHPEKSQSAGLQLLKNFMEL